MYVFTLISYIKTTKTLASSLSTVRFTCELVLKHSLMLLEICVCSIQKLPTFLMSFRNLWTDSRTVTYTKDGSLLPI